MTSHNHRTSARAPEFTLGDRIRKAIETSPLTVHDVADRLEVHRNTVSQWMHGRSAPSVSDMAAIAELTGVDLRWLRTGDPPCADCEPAQFLVLTRR